MRIAYVCADAGIPVFGTKGASVHVQEVLRVLLDAGHTVELFCRRTGGEPWPRAARAIADGRLRVRDLGRVTGRDAAERESLAMIADTDLRLALESAGPFDAVYERYSLWSTAGTAHAKDHDLPSVLEVNAPLPEEQARHRGLVHVEEAWEVARRAVRAATAVVCVSEPVADWARALLPAGHPGTVTVEANGVDVDRIRPADSSAGATASSAVASSAASTSAADRPFTVGFVGTLKPWHGTEHLLHAHALLRRTVPDARLLIVGDGPEAAALAALAEKLGTAEDVELAGAVAPLEVPALLHRMDAAAAPYPSGGEGYFSPLKVYEYMAAGLPVVASAVGQLPALVDPGTTGLLVPGSDPAALAAALVELAADPARRTAMGAAARDRVTRQHTWTHVVERSLAAAGLALRAGDDLGPGRGPDAGVMPDAGGVPDAGNGTTAGRRVDGRALAGVGGRSGTTAGRVGR